MAHRRTTPIAFILVAGAVLPVWAQPASRAWEAVGGAALGAVAGGIVGSLGSLMPCNNTMAGPACVRAAVTGSVVAGGIAGALVGGTQPLRLETAARGAAIGFGVGSVLGVALTPFIHRWGPGDAFALGLIGGAVGTAPTGAAIGFGVGAVAGLALWQTVPGFGSPNAAAFALGGLAVGVLAEWVMRAAAAESDAPLTLGFRVRF
jgi:hypothetical protein